MISMRASQQAHASVTSELTIKNFPTASSPFAAQKKAKQANASETALA
jgi:hypothetical protein